MEVPRRLQSGVVRYGAALAFTGTALALTLLLEGVLSQGIYLVFFAAVIAVAWLAGLGPALLATLLSIGLVDWLFLDPRGGPGLHEATDAVALLTFAGVAAGVAWLEHRARTALTELEVRRRELEEERRQADAAMHRSRILAEAGRLLTGAPGYEEGLEALAALACREMADYCVTYTLDEEGSVRRVGVAHAETGEEERVHRLLDIRPPTLEDEFGAGAVIRRDEPVLAREIPPELLARAAQSPRHLEVLRALGPVSSMVLPLRARGRTIGAIAFATTERSGRRYGDTDLEFAEELADRAALALDNLRLLERARSEVAERERAEAELREREREFRALAEHAPDIIARLDREHRHLYVNPAVEEATGIPPERFLGRTSRDLGLEEELAESDAGVDRVVATGREITTEFALSSPGGTRWYASRMVPEFDAEGEVSSVLCIIRDVTDRKLAEIRQSLLVEAGLLFTSSLDPDATLSNVARLVVRTLADWCIIDLVDEEGGRERANATASSPEDQAKLREVTERFPPDLDDPAHPIGRVLRTGEPALAPEVDETLLQRVARSEEHLRLLRELEPGSYLVVPLHARGRALGTITLVCRRGGRVYGPDDLSLARELAVQAALALDNARLFRQAQEAVRAREEILAVVAHDLRNPLHGIATATAALRALDLSEERALRLLDNLERATRRADRLIRDLLDVSRMEAGEFRVSPEPVEAADLLEEALEAGRLRAEDAEIAVESRVSADPEIRLRADRHRVLQVFSNLLDNAVEHASSGGRITLDMRRKSTEVEFSVTDGGPGIPEEELPRVFDRFWQGGGTGAGLGLAIVKGIVEAHGGRVWAESPPEGGATFRFTLPTAEEGTDAEEGAPTPAPGS